MKRLCLVLSLCLTALVPFAGAEESVWTRVDSAAAVVTAEQAAEALHALGLFQGTGVNADGSPQYELDRVPTRNQAVILLVRLLGKEDEARAGTWTTPFRDVPSGSVSAPYIGYAYAHGLTKGTTETTYSGTRPVTRNQYLLFLMRAMGYASHTQYADIPMSTDQAAGVAEELDLLDGTDAGHFTRGDAAVLSYRALDACMCYLKPNAQTLREALGLGASPKLQAWPLPVSMRKYDSLREIEREYVQRDDTPVRQELAVPGGKIIHFAWETPHGSVEMLVHAGEDGTLAVLPLPQLGFWGTHAAPRNLAYDAASGAVTYEAEIAEDLEWFHQFLRRAGTYRFAYDLTRHTAAVTEL